MGFENMRSGHARFPIYLVAGLIVISFLLMCNWWSSSSQNYELLRQMDDMGAQLNICSDERAICQTRRNSLDGQVKEMKTRLLAVETNNNEEIGKIKKQKSDLEKAVYNAKQDLTYCKAELESLKKVDSSKQTTLESLKLEKESLSSQLIKAKEMIAELEESLKKSNAETNKSKFEQSNVPNLPKYSKTTMSQKKVQPKEPEIQDALPYPSINDGPVADGNHESNKEVETALENAANEDLDDNAEPDVLKRPQIIKS